MNLDCIIVGQGIAGTVLAETLIKLDKKILVIDPNLDDTSSKVAAGICNPITGRFLSKTWQADLLFPFLQKFYTDLEKKLDVTFLHKKAVYRTFKSIEEQNQWFGRSSTTEWKDYLNTQIDDSQYSAWIDNPLGGWETQNSFQVDTKVLLENYKNYLIENQAYLNEKVNYEDIQIADNQIIWKEYTAQKIIFCEGANAINNPYFNYLPFSLVKGEWLKIEVLNNKLQNIINQGIFILPLQEPQLYMVGATYHWHDLTTQISEQARKELTDKLDAFLKLPYQIIEQKAGIRPATKHRRPLVGLHPKFPALGIFNGLGTKGVSLAPYFAWEFGQYLNNPQNFNLHAEVDIQKF